MNLSRELYLIYLLLLFLIFKKVSCFNFSWQSSFKVQNKPRKINRTNSHKNNNNVKKVKNTILNEGHLSRKLFPVFSIGTSLVFSKHLGASLLFWWIILIAVTMWKKLFVVSVEVLAKWKVLAVLKIFVKI